MNRLSRIRVPDLLLVLLSPLSVALLFHSMVFGCAGSNADVEDARAAAARMRADLAEADGLLDAYGPALETLCNFRDVPQCGPAMFALQGMRDAYKLASQGLDVYDATGVLVSEAVPRAQDVLNQVRAFGLTMQAIGEEVSNVVADSKAPSPGGGGVGPSDAPAAESPSGAAPAGAP